MTELEMIMLEWFGKMIGLPKEFLPLTEGGKGGGVIQVTRLLQYWFLNTFCRVRRVNAILFRCSRHDSK
jgi:hypothetical protein